MFPCLCKPANFFTHTSPVKARRRSRKQHSFVLEMIFEGRRLIPKFVDKEVAELMHDLVHDPTPLCKALLRYPQTLAHTDVRMANLGIERGRQPRLIMLDWARQTRTVPAVDLIYYLLSSHSADANHSIDQSIDLYRQQLARRLGDRFDESWWQPQLDLSILGTFATMACFTAWGAEHAEDHSYRQQEKENLQWWAERARVGAQWLA